MNFKAATATSSVVFSFDQQGEVKSLTLPSQSDFVILVFRTLFCFQDFEISWTGVIRILGNPFQVGILDMFVDFSYQP